MFRMHFIESNEELSHTIHTMQPIISIGFDATIASYPPFEESNEKLIKINEETKNI